MISTTDILNDKKNALLRKPCLPQLAQQAIGYQIARSSKKRHAARKFQSGCEENNCGRRSGCGYFGQQADYDYTRINGLVVGE